MESPELSLEDKISMVNESRDRIHHETTMLSQYIQALTNENNEKDKELILNFKREIRMIIKELNKIGGFCDRSTRRMIAVISEIGSRFTIYSTSMGIQRERPIIEYWASCANALNIDYNKSPFSISAGFKVNFKALEAFVKGKYGQLD